MKDLTRWLFNGDIFHQVQLISRNNAELFSMITQGYTSERET